MFSDEHLYSIALRKCSNIGDINFYKLVNSVGSAQEVWSFPKRELAKILGIGSRTVQEIGSSEPLYFAEEELKFCERHQIQIRLRHLGDLTALLNECEDAPAVLYQKGSFSETRHPVSMVGTRNITPYGKQFVHDFFEEVNRSKAISVSGLALGVDTEVHEQSLQHEIPTIAVLAHGFHTLYPSRNRKLADRILESGGALISEFNSSQKPDRENFIQRNRIVAGFSEATIVVETAFGGGSISTVTFANLYNREVYALPGKITDKYSQGCNLVIVQNKARIISTVSELVDELGFGSASDHMETLFPRAEMRKQISEDQKIIYDIICKSPNISLDEIAHITSVSSHKILPVLLELELSGLLKSLSGRQYIAI
ncbi:MAG: DNA-processing protein DprA [Weeksellaceae bacterium]|nr:DNA-processing protein DprA [Weeksellaceae bacterium]